MYTGEEQPSGFGREPAYSRWVSFLEDRKSLT